MQKEVFDRIANAIKGVDIPERREVYTEAFKNGTLICQDVNRRYRWDCFVIADRKNGNTLLDVNPGECDLNKRHGGINDAHIDTALRKIVHDLV